MLVLPDFRRRRIARAGADGEVEAVVGQTLVDQGVLHALLDRPPKAVLTVLDTSRETRLYDSEGTRATSPRGPWRAAKSGWRPCADS